MGVLARFERFGDGAAGPALDRGACSPAWRASLPAFRCDLVPALGLRRYRGGCAPVADLGGHRAHHGGGQLFRRAVQVVAESQKASTSYVQRQLRVGYNSAARLIERMESEGLVSRPDHVGRREVLMDPDGRPMG